MESATLFVSVLIFRKHVFLSSGWMNQTLFHRWFDQIFLKHTKDLPRPLLLIVDGHGSHFDVQTLTLAVKNDVYVMK